MWKQIFCAWKCFYGSSHDVEKLRLCRQSTHRGGKCYVSQWIFSVSRESSGVIGGFVTDPKWRAETNAECDDTKIMNASPWRRLRLFLLHFYGMTRRSLWCSRRKLFDHRQRTHDSSIIHAASSHQTRTQKCQEEAGGVWEIYGNKREQLSRDRTAHKQCHAKIHRDGWKLFLVQHSNVSTSSCVFRSAVQINK